MVAYDDCCESGIGYKLPNGLVRLDERFAIQEGTIDLTVIAERHEGIVGGQSQAAMWIWSLTG